MKRIRRKHLAILATIGLVLVGAVLSWHWLQKPQQAQADEVITQSTDTPSETPPDRGGYVWKGGPNDPKKLRIETIGVDAFVQKVGVDQNKQIAVPTNIFVTGWFVDMARPGEPGLSVIDGHLDGRTADGVFIRLKEMQAGDRFTLERGDGKQLAYETVSVKVLPTEEAAAELFSQDPKIKSQLNLITCGGNFNESARSYDERVIVSAQLVDTN